MKVEETQKHKKHGRGKLNTGTRDGNIKHERQRLNNIKRRGQKQRVGLIRSDTNDSKLEDVALLNAVGQCA